jgi:hypothetical protein
MRRKENKYLIFEGIMPQKLSKWDGHLKAVAGGSWVQGQPVQRIHSEMVSEKQNKQKNS